MKIFRTMLGVAALAAVGASAITAWQSRGGPPSPPAPSDRVRGVIDVLYARPFRLAEGYTHWFRRERPTAAAGYLIVLDVDPDLVVPRQLYEPVLYVGEETAERVNHGHPSGRAVVIVPCALGPDGEPAVRLEDCPIWFGSPALPEEVGAAEVRGELAKAWGAGVRPFAAARIGAALEAGGALLLLPDKTALERVAAELVLRYAPGEEELARSLLVPLDR